MYIVVRGLRSAGILPATSREQDAPTTRLYPSNAGFSISVRVLRLTWGFYIGASRFGEFIL
jgi:hypothetical protein